MSDPAGWSTTSVTTNAASPAIFSDTCSPVPVNAIELANAMRSAETCGSSRGLALIRCGVDGEMSLTFGVRLDRLTPCPPAR